MGNVRTSILGLEAKAKELGLLFSAHWSITESCNLRCKHCFMSKKNVNVYLEDAEYILEFLKNNNFLKLSISGGECFLNPQFESIYLMAIKAGMLVSIMSNGTNFTEGIRKLLCEYKPYDIAFLFMGLIMILFIVLLVSKMVLQNLNLD